MGLEMSGAAAAIEKDSKHPCPLPLLPRPSPVPFLCPFLPAHHPPPQPERQSRASEATHGSTRSDGHRNPSQGLIR